jgi:HD-like signal output (HDOD) protein
MPAENDYNINDALRRLDRLTGLNDRQLDALSDRADMRQAPRGACLLPMGSTDARQLFLLDGEIELVAGDGARHRVRSANDVVQGPLSCLRPSRYRVTALSDVSYLLVEQSLLDELDREPSGEKVEIEEVYLVSEPRELISDSATHPLMFDVFEALNQGRIVVPSEPDIAVRVGRALNDANIDARRLADTLSVCPALTLKTLRAAMKANPGRSSIRSARDAVQNLGEEEAFGLAVHCVLRETLRTDSALLSKRMHQWWERTIRVSAISRELAQMSPGFDAEYAALIGLLHSIAEPVLLNYANRHSDLDDAATLDNLLYENRAELGRILLSMWNLPRDIIDAAARCNQWEYEHAGDANHTDIMLVAQWHATIGESPGRPRPTFEQIPAFRRLGLDPASPELSLSIVEAADNAIEEAEKLLAP